MGDFDSIIEMNELVARIREACGEPSHPALKHALPVYGAVIGTGGFALALYKEVDEKLHEGRKENSTGKHDSTDRDDHHGERGRHHDGSFHRHADMKDCATDEHHHHNDFGEYFFASAFPMHDFESSWTNY